MAIRLSRDDLLPMSWKCVDAVARPGSITVAHLISTPARSRDGRMILPDQAAMGRSAVLERSRTPERLPQPTPGGGQVTPKRAGSGSALPPARLPPASRSEEPTSELQSLMRLSYDVFSLKK